jgi:hypothetical protein
VREDACEHRVLDHVREIAGVERVAVIHRLSSHKPPRIPNRCAGRASTNP